MKHRSIPDSSRRRSLTLLGGGVALALSGRTWTQEPVPACTVTPEQTEGPYFLDARLQRSDIRGEPGDGSHKPGLPLALSLRLLSVSGNRCVPLIGAGVDLWHCDAAGVYSGVEGNKARFLRGYQLSDAQGRVRFVSIYPGWYPGRAVHVHFKVRSPAVKGAAAGAGHEFTSQFYFDEALNDKVFAAAPYARAGDRTRNAQDGIYRAGGQRLMLAPVQSGQGYAASFDIGIRV